MKAQIALRSGWVRCGLAMLIALSLAFAARPADACGCGIYIPRDGEASVSEEHVLIRWDGQTEDIVMTLGVLGGSKEAAVIFPVPTRATVKLADAQVFEALRELTKPRVENVYSLFPVLSLSGAAMAPGSAVTLLERQTLGPFDVSTLAATDASALGDWLKTNGYNLPPEVTQALAPYVAQGWYYIAVRLSPGAGAGELKGKLDPLWISFPYGEIVYPMRPSALARNALTVFMYVLADHRVEKAQSFGYQQVQYAGWVDPASLEKDSPLAAFVPKKLFLTKIVEQIYDPKSIDSDYIFQFTAQDDVYQMVEYHHIYDIAGIPLCILAPCGLWLIVIAGVVVLVRLLAKKRPGQEKI